MTRKTVAKFGGSSVETADAMQQVAAVVESNRDIGVVVLSAVGGITNRLVAFCQAPHDQRGEMINEIEAIHLAIATALALPEKVAQAIHQQVGKLTEIDGENLSNEVFDEVLALGEQLSTRLVASLLEARGAQVLLLDVRKVMITDDHFGKAVPDLAVIKQRCNEFIASVDDTTIVVTQGFIGATADGRTTTLGRGGSDFTAALLAEALACDQLAIYTDVSGVYTMDPNIVTNAHPIAQISFQEMAEMANFGAKILHPATLEPCIRSAIPVRILSTFAADSDGTLITLAKRDDTAPPLVHAITLRKKQILVTIKSLNMLNACGFLAKVFTILADHKISVDLLTTSEVSVALTIDGASLGSHENNPFKNQIVLNALHEFSQTVVEEELTLLAVIGIGLNRPGMTQRILAKLKGYFIRLICYGASASSIGILVKQRDANAIATLLHEDLIEGDRYQV